MKPLTKILFAAVFAAATCSTINTVSAQQTIATWWVNAQTNLPPPNPFTNNTANANVIVYPMTKGFGIGEPSGTAEYGGNNWTNNVVGGSGATDTEANAIAGGHYITYSIQAAPGYTVSFSTNVLYYHISATGPYHGELQYSTDGVNYTDISTMTYGPGATAETALLTNNLSTVAALQNVPSTTTNFFRIVNWSATSGGGTWYIYDNPPAAAGTNGFVVSGAVKPVPPAQNLATWWCGPLVNGGGAAPAPFANNTANANVIVGLMMKGSGIGAVTTSDAYGGNTWTNAGFADSEANSIANGLYVTYSVQAAPGYTISFLTNYLYAHASSTGPHNGELQYSTDGVNYTDILPMSYGSGTISLIVTNNLSTIAALQNVPSTTTNFFRIVNWGATGTAGTWYIYDPPPGGTVVGTNDFVVIGGLTSPVGGVAPNNLVVSPSSVTVDAGSTVAFTVTAEGDPASNFWYKVVGSSTNLIAGQTTSTLTLNNVSAADTANYFVILTNATGSATSSVVSLTVIDPAIITQPASAYGLLDGTVQFAVTAAGTSPAYRWYFTDTSGNIIGPVNNGTQGSGSVVFGATSSVLTITNLQFIDPTNFVVVVTNVYSAVTSSVASLISVGNQETLAFWNFNQTNFPNTLNNPAPWFGVGTASAVGGCYDPGTSPFSGVADPSDGPGFGLGSTYYSWGTDNYPATGGNKQNGVQFNVSTVGAKNITVSYDSRVSATASDYERLQYTTDGSTWTDFPSSSTFGGVGTTYLSYSYNLTGFPGVANNPNFGIRVVTEFQSTATYGVSANANYVGTANSYGTGGTVTYDRVNISGDAITNGPTGPYSPPTISSFMNTNTPDYVPLTLSFTVGSTLPGAPGNISVSAASLNTATVNPSFSYGGIGANRTLTITFPGSFIPDAVDVAPILVTVTDGNGDSTATWFDLTVTSINLPPTNSLTGLAATNTLANTALTIPFTVGDDRTPVSGLTYSVASDNNTLVPSGNIVVIPNGANPTVTITPALNQLGVGVVSVTVNDNDSVEPRSTTANIAFMVRPNTNVVAIDYFDYDTSGALDTVSAGYWKHLSGVLGQMQVGSGVVTVDTLDNTENLQAKLLGAPYQTNSGAVLYSCFVVNMDPSRMPLVNGTYFATFNDGSGTTGNYECRVLAATNGAATGHYRIGIDNFGADATDGQLFPKDLLPNSNYVVVTALVLTNGFSTVWVNPNSQSSPSVTDTTYAPAATNLFSIADFELRESGVNGGSVRVSQLKVGTTFDSVFPSLHVQPAGTNVIVNWSDPTLGIQSATNILSPFADVSGATPPYTNNASTNKTMFFRFKR